MNKHSNIQVEKDLKTIHRIEVFGIALFFLGFLVLTGLANTHDLGEEVPSWAIIMDIVQIVLGFVLANLLPILRFFFNPKENTRVKRKIRKEAEHCQKDFEDSIELVSILFVGALMCLTIILFI